MSDTAEPVVVDDVPASSDDKGGKTKKNGKGKDAPPAEPGAGDHPRPARPDLAEVLFDLWGPGKRGPDLIEIYMVRFVGDQLERRTRLRQYPFHPSEQKRAPTREELVALSNSMVTLMQHNCNSVCAANGKKSQLYGVFMYMGGQGADTAACHAMRLHPTSRERMTGDASTADDDGFRGPISDDGEGLLGAGGAQGAFLSYSLVQNRQALEHTRFLIKEMADMSRYTNETLRNENESLRQQIVQGDKARIDMLKATEELINQKAKRDNDAKWADLGVTAASRVVDTALTWAPPIVQSLVSRGKPQAQLSASDADIVRRTDTQTIRDFVEKSTPEQSAAAFGCDATGKPIVGATPIFTQEQCYVLGLVAAGEADPGRVREFLPGGRLAITSDQLVRVQQHYPEQQLFALKRLMMRLMEEQASAQQQVASNGVPPASPKPE